MEPDRLDKIIEQQRMEQQLFTDPAAVTGLLERYYREQGYLSAAIDAPRYDFAGTRARVVLTVSAKGRASWPGRSRRPAIRYTRRRRS